MGAALLTWSKTFTNFNATMAACRYFGWTEASIGEPCSWGGINCNSNATTFEIKLRQVGLQCECLSCWDKLACAALSAITSPCVHVPMKATHSFHCAKLQQAPVI